MKPRAKHIPRRPQDEPVYVNPANMDFEKRRLLMAAQTITANMIADGALDYGLSFYAEVTTYTDTTHFKAAGLAGKGTGAFKTAGGSPYEIYVFQADGAAPEGQMTPVVAYTTADGTFQHAAYSGGNLAVGDIVLIIHPILASLGVKGTAAASGAVTTTDYLMAYVKQLVTGLILVVADTNELQTDWADGGRLDLLIDAIKAVTDALPDAGALSDLAAILVLADSKVMGRLQIASTTEDLNQAAGTYDLFTGSTQAVILEKLNVKMPTGAAGGAVTSIAIVTDDATAGTIISATDGAVANLTSEAELGWTGTLLINTGTKIRLTIAGGAHGSEYLVTVVAQCRAVVSGGYLA